MPRHFFQITFLVMALLAPAGALPPKIMFLGDSRTAGPHAINCYRRLLDSILTVAQYEFDFVGSLQGHDGDNHLPETGFDNFDWDHEGRWGWPTNNLLPQVGQWARAKSPDIVLALLGTTDLAYESDSLRYDRNKHEIEAVIDTLRTVNPKIIILLANLYPANDSLFSEVLHGFNPYIAAIVDSASTQESPLFLVDTWTGFRRIGDLVDPLHANWVGCTLIAQRWFEKLQPVLDYLLDPSSSILRATVPKHLPYPNQPSHRLTVLIPAQSPASCYTISGRRIPVTATIPAIFQYQHFMAVITK